MNESPGALELLSNRVDELEKRVHALEHPNRAENSATAQQNAHPTLGVDDAASALETRNVFPILGRAMLGIAGAYVLRATAQAGVIPNPAVSTFAVAYAFGWLGWSARASSNLARVVYAGTSALILAPMLWENTLTFQVFTPVTSAGVLSAFLIFAAVLELRCGTIKNMWIAESIAALTAASLAVATHHVLPFVATLLVAVGASEFARTRNLARPIWPLIVLLADAAVWGLIFIYSGPQNARAAYPDLSVAVLMAPAVVLFALNGATVAVRVVVYTNEITTVEVVQVMIAFALAVAATLSFVPQHGSIFVGILALTLSACTYTATFGRLRFRSGQRSFRVFGTWSAALLIAGSLWSLPRPGAAIVLAFVAVAAIAVARRIKSGMLEWQSGLFLTLAAAIAGLPQYIYGAVAGTRSPYLTTSLMMVSVCAAVIQVVAGGTTENAWQRVLHFIPPLLAVGALIALLVNGTLAGTAHFISLDEHHVAFLRTLTICVVVLLLAFGGSRIERTELTHLAYTALAFVAAKLVFEDLRHGHMEFTAGSIALFAITLIAMPRVVRLGAQRRASSEREAPVHGSRSME